VAEKHVGFVHEVWAEVAAVRVRLAVQDAADLELVQVAVLPAERRLDVQVERVEGAVGNVNPPPDRRSDVEQRDLEVAGTICVPSPAPVSFFVRVRPRRVRRSSASRWCGVSLSG